MKRGVGINEAWQSLGCSSFILAAHASRLRYPRAVTSTLTTMRDAMFGLMCYFPTLETPNSHSSYRVLYVCISEYVYACALLLITNDGRYPRRQGNEGTFNLGPKSRPSRRLVSSFSFRFPIPLLAQLIPAFYPPPSTGD
jgi:hypothetical protein